MNWKYYIPHEWESDRCAWEDIWLMPSIHAVSSQSYWLTIDAASYIDDEQKQALGSSPYLINGDDMVVNADNFSKDELLEYARIWLSEKGFTDVQLIEGTYEEFQGSNEDAKAIEIAKKRLNELDKNCSEFGT